MSYNSDSISHQVNEFHGLNAVQFLRRGVSFSRKLGMSNWISQPVSHIHGRALPEPAIPVGYAALIERFGLSVPVPPRLAAIAERHHPVSNQSWNLLTPRHRPPNTLEGQIVFALKWEGLDLGVLGALFKVKLSNLRKYPSLYGLHPPVRLHGESGSCTNGSPDANSMCR